MIDLMSLDTEHPIIYTYSIFCITFYEKKFRGKIDYITINFLKYRKIFAFFFLFLRGIPQILYTRYILNHYGYLYYESITNVSYNNYTCLLN